MDKLEIIAEIANAHQGDINIAFQLAEQAFLSGADAVKFQIYFAEELLIKKHPRYEHFKKQSFSEKVWLNLINKTKALGIKVYSDIYGSKAFELARKCNIDGYKIHSSDLSNFEILSKINELKNGEKVILSCGGSNIREISYALKNIKNYPLKPILMHGFQSYPTKLEDSNLNRISLLKNIFEEICEIGFQDHISGDSQFSMVLPLLAISKGAKIIEKHITLNRAEKGIDYYSSLEPSEFKSFIKIAKDSYSSYGVKKFEFSDAEITYRNTVKKKAVATRYINKGEIITDKDITYKRVPDIEIETALYEDLIGRKTTENIDKETIISKDKIENKIYGLIIARMRSKRLPNKAMLNIGVTTAIEHLIERVKQSKNLNKIILCTTENQEDNKLVDIAIKHGIYAFRGEANDVLGRMLGAVKKESPDIIVRIAGDDILVDPDYIDRGLKDHLQKNSEYTDLKSLPSGTEVEIFNHALLKEIYICSDNKNQTKYLTYFITKNKFNINMNSLKVDSNHNKNWRLTLDTKNDYHVILEFIEYVKRKGKIKNYRLDDIVDFFEKNLDLFQINKIFKTHKSDLDIDTKMDWKYLLNDKY